MGLLIFAKLSDGATTCGAGWHPAHRLVTGAGRLVHGAAEGGLPTRRRFDNPPHKDPCFCRYILRTSIRGGLRA